MRNIPLNAGNILTEWRNTVIVLMPVLRAQILRFEPHSSLRATHPAGSGCVLEETRFPISFTNHEYEYEHEYGGNDSSLVIVIETTFNKTGIFLSYAFQHNVESVSQERSEAISFRRIAAPG